MLQHAGAFRSCGFHILNAHGGGNINILSRERTRSLFHFLSNCLICSVEHVLHRAKCKLGRLSSPLEQYRISTNEMYSGLDYGRKWHKQRGSINIVQVS